MEDEFARIELVVLEESAGERLDRFVAEQVDDLSRSRVKALVEEGNVLVNGRPEQPKRLLKTGETVIVNLPPTRKGTMSGEDIPLDVLFEDEDILVLNKPVGLVVHPAPGNRGGTLANAVLHHAPGISVGGEERPGLVHRLDKDTSGVMVVAKSERAYQALIKEMKARRVRRSYAALCAGVIGEDEGLIEAPIGRDPNDRKKMAVVPQGRPAITHFHVKERFRGGEGSMIPKGASLLDVELETGRTHQIRVHLAHIGYPVVGDRLYGGRSRGGAKVLSIKDPEGVSSAGIGRQALHAQKLSFKHPVDGRSLEFTAPLPEDMNRLIEALRLERDQHGDV